MTRIDRIALLLSLVAIAAAYLVEDRVFNRMPHIEDEMAYVWQAQVLAQGKLTLPSPPDPKLMLVPFVVDYHGQRFGKYPLGWPMLLTFSLLLRARDWVNPILAGLSLWLTYQLGKKLFDERIALLAAFLTLSSPFFLLNSGSLLSHSWALFLSLAFVLAWLDTFHHKDTESTKDNLVLTKKLSGIHAFVVRKPPVWLTVSVAGLSLGVLAMTRPLTAVGVGLPFFIHGIILLARGDRSARIRILTIGFVTVIVTALIPLWQFAVTGNPLLNPYTFWWPYDKVGFGPGVGSEAGGHNLYWAWFNLQSSMKAGWGDFFGWGHISWLFLPFGAWSLGRDGRRWLMALVFPSLLLVYMAYWIGSNLFGPRYYYEGFYSVALVSAAGMFWLAEQVIRSAPMRRWMQVATVLLGVVLVGYNLIVYLPKRFNEMTDLYGISRSMLIPFETATAKSLTPALVVVHFRNSWTDYGGLLELENADLTSPFIFALSHDRNSDLTLKKDYPARIVIYYYSDQPNVFYLFPK
ncbi:MAG TPA: STT3 domain-containing protein [Anaerolineales bacterium]